MSNGATPPDDRERELALDPAQSFLVQAPAGAGKTELLIQRYLRLLAEVDEPEEILAVTFTRKAAAEMQRRIFAALTAEDPGLAPDSPNQRRMRALVGAVRARDLARGWGLEGHPARLRISTIDALNAALARSQPYTNGAHALRPVAAQPALLYREAARHAVGLLADGDGAGEAVACLLGHLDNQPARLEALLAGLLARRDQWLPILGSRGADEGTRARLEAALARIVSHDVAALEALLPPDRLAPFHEIVQAASANLRRTAPGGPGRRHGLPERLGWWRVAADTWLTRAGDWRTRFDVRGGFPPDQKDLKRSAEELVPRLRECAGLNAHLHGVRQLPDPVYPEAQWRALDALLRLLPLAAAELKLCFAERGETDFIEVAAEARTALGQDEAPSELALRVDWRIRHVLLDEFQDTSQAQYALLRALIRGWSPGDGRSLFLVGDPMQSIYRFRQAEVRLFLETRDRGLPGVDLRFLRLQANFRSQPAIVQWVNRVFPRIFPGSDDTLTSAVAFAPSQAFVEPPGPPAGGVAAGNDPACCVELHATGMDESGVEAAEVLRLVKDCLRRWPEDTVGILVRSRAHATGIVSALRQDGVPFTASDLVELGKTAVASDLLALTHCLLHAADRLAWFAVLRGPCGGLSLADMERLAQLSMECGPGDACRDESVLALLSPDGRERASRVGEALGLARRRRGQVPLRDLVEGLWMELGGPVHGAADLALADLALAQIEGQERGGDCPDVLALDDALATAPTSLAGAGAQVQVMTIHKAKGLQFDTVIVPALGRKTRVEARPALLWEEVALDDGRAELLLAPVNATGEETDPLYDMLWRLKSEQAAAETDRLLYVATTRACKRLHLFGAAPAESEATREPTGEAPVNEVRGQPAAGSLLARLWPAVAAEWPAAPAVDEPVAEGEPTAGWITPRLRRLPVGWRRPAPPASLDIRLAGQRPRPELPTFDWATAWTIHAGAVTHRWLQQIAVSGVERFGSTAMEAARASVRRLLIRAGVGSGDLDRATERVCMALSHAVTDESGRWILSRERGEAVNEFAITVADAEGLRQLIVDRSFVSEDGVRWIVDYKTGGHEGGDRERFLRSEAERYGPQLAAYRDAFSRLDPRPIQTALYYPLLRTLLRVDPAG